MAAFGYLSDFFSGVAFKRLSAVEIDALRSNQHEFNGVASMKQLWGSERNIISARFLYLGEHEEDRVFADGTLTWYDAREAHPSRSEFRLYYQDNQAIQQAKTGDLLLIAKRDANEALVILAKKDSTHENRLAWLFRIETTSESFNIKELSIESDREADFLVRSILEDLEIEIEPEDMDFLEWIFDRFGPTFPPTVDFSRFARSTIQDAPVIEDPDACFMLWFEREEFLFRTLERYLVLQRLQEGFETVEDFIQYSLSTLNRRKARVGHAIEHHLEEIFVTHHLRFTRGGYTELKAQPDFIFPGIHEYHDLDFPTDRLSMLGVKSTCKDRWRQVLSEALRISHKHLFTLEGGISTTQTDEMMSHNLALILPASLHASFRPEQRDTIMTLTDFVDLLRTRAGKE
ncbi:MAG: restriction endonuclease [Bacteroidetes bacterium]|nr:restriction endonuclease [Bacteroidota bacterium]